jgi:hypothetical protein
MIFVAIDMSLLHEMQGTLPQVQRMGQELFTEMDVSCTLFIWSMIVSSLAHFTIWNWLASGALIKAAGVEEPTAIAVTYDSFDRCLRATACLRDAFPDTP